MDDSHPHLDQRFCANVSMLFTEVPYERRFEAARDAGFSSIETWWPFSGPSPSNAEVDRFLRALASSGLRLSAMNFYAGDMPAGERGVACLPDRQHQLDESTDVLIRVAEATGCVLFNLLYGQLGDRWPAEDQHHTAASAISRSARRVGSIGGTVLLEALARDLNGTYPLHVPEDVVRIVDDLDEPNIGFLFDTFHLGSNGVDLVAAARRHSNMIGHVQVADAPGRGEPASGSLPIMETLGALHAAGYTGAIGCEYRPTRTTAETLGWIPLARSHRRG